jgi:DNA-binding LacI/PurR family transcriptional regulator
MAAGALLAARRLGRRVPEDLAVAGFDDVPEAAFYFPSLTTIRQPLAELGGQAVDILIEMLSARIDNQPSGFPQTRWLQPQLVIRSSSIRSTQPLV